jgi:hypothetical protein
MWNEANVVEYQPEEKPSPATSKAGRKALVAKQYAMVRALTDNGEGDPKIQRYLARLAAILDTPD